MLKNLLLEQLPIIDILTGFIPLLFIMGIFHLVMILAGKRKNIKPSPLHIAGVYVFCFFLMGIFFLTNTPKFDMLRFYTFTPTLHLLPFADINTNYLHYVLNLLLFVPIGFLLPTLWKQFEKSYTTFLCGFLLSLFVEITQLLTSSITSINDLLMNTFGTIVGYYLFKLAKKIVPKVSIFSLDQLRYWRWEPFFCFFLAWNTRFFIQSFFAPSWLDFVYGY